MRSMEPQKAKKCIGSSAFPAHGGAWMSGRVIDEVSHRHNSHNILAKVFRAYRDGGFAYLWHKSMRRSLERWPTLKRRAIYSNPKEYWTLRGGLEYLAEQEGQPARTARSLWLARKIAECKPRSMLEIGCGYGKQLINIQELLGHDVHLTGIDFSESQLELARQNLQNLSHIRLLRASGDRLPFADQSFDLVLTSAVILHNPPEIAERIREEVLRVARRWCVHNEDTDVSYNRYGYDTADWYRSRGLNVVEAGPIPASVFKGSNDPEGESARSQFCLVQLV
jgi:SAM-dependent methyltransferase